MTSAEENNSILFYREPFSIKQIRENCLKGRFRGYFQEIWKETESLLTQPVPKTRYTRFNQFRADGSRNRYQEVFFQKHLGLASLYICALVTRDKRFYAKMEAYIRAICNEFTPCIPARLADKLEIDEDYIDLFSCMSARQLAEIIDIMGIEISPEVKERAMAGINERIIEPSLKDIERFWWAKAYDSNWCAVCCGAIGSTVILTTSYRENKKEVSDLLADINQRLSKCLDNFDPDGAWTEGLGYWQYGLEYLVDYADLLYKFTKGKTNLFKHPFLEKTCFFPIHCYLPEHKAINFGDCENEFVLHRGFINTLTGYIKPGGGYLRWLEDKTEDFAGFKESLFNCGLRTLFNYGKEDNKPPEKKLVWYKKTGWIIGRKSWVDKNGPVFAVKIGHNGESHNQLDIGHFIFHVFGETFLPDLGAGLYNRDYFGGKRYENIFCNSQGHSVLLIDGQGQGIGREYSGKVISLETTAKSDKVLIDLTPAYSNPKIEKIIREIKFTKKGQGLFQVEDMISAKRGTKIESRIQLIAKPVLKDNRATIVTEQGNLQIKVDCSERFSLEVGVCKNLLRQSSMGRQKGPFTAYFLRINCVAKNECEIKIKIQCLPLLKS